MLIFSLSFQFLNASSDIEFGVEYPDLSFDERKKNFFFKHATFDLNSQTLLHFYNFFIFIEYKVAYCNILIPDIAT